MEKKLQLIIDWDNSCSVANILFMFYSYYADKTSKEFALYISNLLKSIINCKKNTITHDSKLKYAEA